MNRYFKVTGAIVVTGVAVGYTGFWGAPVAHASTHQTTLQYTCTVANMGTQSGSLELSWDSPDAVTVGQPTPPITFTSTEVVPSFEVEIAHTYQGFSSVSENGDATVTASAPQENVSRTVPFGLPTTTVPASGSLTIVYSGTLPSVKFPQPGVAKITVGAITVHETARDSSGNPMYFGTVTETCTPESGQSILLQTVQIDPAAPTPRASTHAAALVPPQTSGPVAPPPPPSVGFGSTGHHHSHATKPAAKPAAHLPAGISGKDIAIIAAATFGTAGVGGLAAWLAATVRQHRMRRRRRTL